MQITEDEYERLIRIAEKDPKLCAGIHCPFQQLYNNKKWSWSQFLIGVVKLLFSPELWIFAIYTWQIHNRFFSDKEEPIYWIMYCVIGICFMFFKPLSNLINSGKLNVNAELGAKISGEIKKEIKDAVPKIGKGDN